MLTHVPGKLLEKKIREKEWKEIQPDYSKSSGAGLVSKESGVRYPQKALKPCTVPKAGLESTRSSQGE